VIELKPDAGQVVVGPKQALQRTSLTASGVNWMVETSASGRRVTAQIRHRHQPAAAHVRPMEGGRLEVTFDSPQVAITPGQAVVCYDDDRVVCGGWID
jgi:tRNA-specific 2-thiouridylase